MKKLVALLIALTLAFSVCFVPVNAADNIVSEVGGLPFVIYLNGNQIWLQYQPLSVNGVLYAPLQSFCTALSADCSVTYDSTYQVATIDSKGIHLTMTVGSDTMQWNYVDRNMSSPVCIISDVVYIPVNIVASAFGYSLFWDGYSNEAFLNSTGTFQTIDWNETRFFIGNVFKSGENDNTEICIGVLYDKTTGAPKTYGFFENGNIREGLTFYDNGDEYIGGFDTNGNKDGYGEYYWATGDYYIGTFKGGKIDGYGEYHWADGAYYIGYNKDGNRDGYGVFYFSDGSYLEGYWSNGQFLGQQTSTPQTPTVQNIVPNINITVGDKGICAFGNCTNKLGYGDVYYCYKHACRESGCIYPICNTNSDYCIYHKCPVYDCYNGPSSYSPYCNRHKCMHYGCQNQRKDNISFYCTVHSR